MLIRMNIIHRTPVTLLINTRFVDRPHSTHVNHLPTFWHVNSCGLAFYSIVQTAALFFCCGPVASRVVAREFVSTHCPHLISDSGLASPHDTPAWYCCTSTFPHDRTVFSGFPEKSESSDDLPQPEGPMMAWRWEWGKDPETRLSTGLPLVRTRLRSLN